MIRGADDDHVDVAASIRLARREGPEDECGLHALELSQGCTDSPSDSPCLDRDPVELAKQRTGTIGSIVQLPPHHLGDKNADAFQRPKLARNRRRGEARAARYLANMQAAIRIGEEDSNDRFATLPEQRGAE